MKKITPRRIYFFITAGILFVCVVAAGMYLYYKPRASLKNSTATATIDAVTLYEAYHKDETTADKKYLSKVIVVKGTVDEVQQTDSTLSITLKAGETGGINCRMVIDNDVKATIPSKGVVISIKGRCSGFLMDVLLVDCLIENDRTF